MRRPPFSTASTAGTHWQIFGGLNDTRLLKPNYEESYREYLPNLGVQYAFAIRDNLIVIAGDEVAYHFICAAGLWQPGQH